MICKPQSLCDSMVLFIVSSPTISWLQTVTPDGTALITGGKKGALHSYQLPQQTQQPDSSKSHQPQVRLAGAGDPMMVVPAVCCFWKQCSALLMGKQAIKLAYCTAVCKSLLVLCIICITGACLLEQNVTLCPCLIGWTAST